MSKNYRKGLNIELHPGLINPRLLKRGRNNNPYLDNAEGNSRNRDKEKDGVGRRQRIGIFYKKGDISKPLEFERRQWKETVLKIERGDLPDTFHDEDKYILKVDDIPTAEWWDRRYYLPERLSDNEEDEDESEDEDKFCPSIKYVLHPVPPKLSNIENNNNNVPFLGMRLYLTPKERKQLRRNKRRLQQEDMEKKIKLGLLPKPANKIKMSTIMNQQGRGVDLPTGWEREVKNAMIARKREHDIMNQRRHEMAVKNQQSKMDVHGQGEGVIWVRVYHFKQLINPSIRYKLSMNSQQLGIKGLCLRKGEDGPGIIIIMNEKEKSIRFMNRLIMNRLPWRENFMIKSYGRNGNGNGNEEQKMIDMSNNEIKLVWTGQVNLEEYNMFPNRWFMKVCQNEQEIKSILAKFEAEHYYKYI